MPSRPSEACKLSHCCNALTTTVFGCHFEACLLPLVYLFSNEYRARFTLHTLYAHSMLCTLYTICIYNIWTNSVCSVVWHATLTNRLHSGAIQPCNDRHECNSHILFGTRCGSHIFGANTWRVPFSLCAHNIYMTMAIHKNSHVRFCNDPE